MMPEPQSPFASPSAEDVEAKLPVRRDVCVVDRALRAAHAAFDVAALKRGAAGGGGGEKAVARVADGDLAVRAEIDGEMHALLRHAEQHGGRIRAGESTKLGTAVVGTVKGDLHDIGKNLVALMMRSANLEVIDLGSNVDGAKFIDAINKYNPDVIGLSALLTTTMNEQGHIIQQLTDAGVRDKVKVMVGGAPVTQMWADKIGADAFTADAAEAAQWAKAYAASKGA